MMTQRQYVRELLSKFGLAHYHTVHTPMAKKLKLEPDMCAPETDPTMYQRMERKLIFLNHTQPDISFVVSIISRLMCKRQKPHLQALKHIHRYL